MLAVRRSLGQYGAALPQYAATQPPAHPIDPGTYAELRAAGEVLRIQGDPGAPQTMELVKRLIEAQGFPSFGTPATPTAGRISDLNPVLNKAAWAMENPYLALAGIVGIPLLFFLLGRSGCKR